MKSSNHIGGNRRRARSVLATALMFVTAALLMIPFYFMFLSSLKPGTEMLRNGLSLTYDPGISSFKNYAALNTYRDGIYWHWYKSSLIIMILQTVIGLALSSMVGYGLAMYRFKGRNAVFTLVLILMMVPFEILLLPLYQMLIKVHLTDTYFGSSLYDFFLPPVCSRTS